MNYTEKIMNSIPDMKERLKKGEILIGPWCIIPSPTVTDIIAKTGVDFVIIDMEHGDFSLETVENMIRAAESSHCIPFVRAEKNDESCILKILELGAPCVIIPHIESRADAERAISHVKYYPVGTRGLSPFTRAGGYSKDHVQAHCKKQNDRTMIILILEGKDGLKNLDDILSIEDIEKKIDIIYVGAYDLSQALGYPGNVDHPVVKKQLEIAIKKIKKNGIAPGGYVAKTQDEMEWMCKIGMQFITLLPDCTIFYHAYESEFKKFKNALLNLKKK
jgi:4-hydroxy-2-oxoheptanedioate aldolase